MKIEFKRAAAAHELLMMNLAIFHLLLPVAALSSGYVFILLTISLFGSAAILFHIAYKSRHNDDKLVQSHWYLAWQRCRLLLLSYSLSAFIMLLGLALALMQSDHNMFSIMLVVFSRIAAVPIVLAVLILFIMSTTSLSQARHGLLAE